MKNEAVTPKFSNISNFYKGKSILVTGVTGFVGKLLVHKLLTTCPGIQNVFAVIRKRRGETPQDRLENILSNPIFAQLGSDKVKKVVAVGGDITEAKLGINAEDRKRLCDEVSVVIHAAASVRFNEPIHKAIRTNLGGAMSMLELAADLKKIDAYVHISTAYSNCNRREIGEVIYPTGNSPNDVIELLKSMSKEEAYAVTPKLLDGRPNTYTFAKSLAEQVVGSHRKDFPVSIVRPSIVTPSAEYPMPGWVEGANGSTKILTDLLRGLARCIHGYKSMQFDLIPVDHVVHLALAAAWYTSMAFKLNSKAPLIYNCCSGGPNPTTYGRTFPQAILVKNDHLYRIFDALLNRLPCQLQDLKAVMLGREPRMMNEYRGMAKFFESVDCFLINEYNFRTENTEQLYGELSQVDQKLFNFDIRSVDWGPYMQCYNEGVRRHFLQ